MSGGPRPSHGRGEAVTRERDAVLATLPEAVRRRLSSYVDLLLRWQPTINLVAPSTLSLLWTRHVADSLQVHAALPDARRWIDLGSGGGFPGLVTAIVLADEPGAHVDLVESDKRKAAFLRAAARETGAPATIHARRIEDFALCHADPVDAVSARALAALPKLLELASPFLDRGAVGVFPKGENGAAELTDSDAERRFVVETRPSRLRDGASLLIVRAASFGGDRASCPSPKR